MPPPLLPRLCLSLALLVPTIAIAISFLNLSLPTFLQHDPFSYPAPLSLPPPPQRVGKWAPNSILRLRVARLGDGLLPKPEDVVALDGAHDEVFVGCEDGWIKRVNTSSGAVYNWVHIQGGRPLGLIAGLHGEIIVCDPNTVCYQCMLSMYAVDVCFLCVCVSALLPMSLERGRENINPLSNAEVPIGPTKKKSV